MPVESGQEKNTASKKKAAAPKAGGKGGGNALTETLKAALKGDLTARVPEGSVSGDNAVAARLVNELLSKLSRQIDDSESRKSGLAHEIENAIEGMMALVKQGDLTRWSGVTEDPQLAPLLEGFNRVIDTLRTFVREINEAALRLSSSSNEVLAASTQHETSSTEQAAAIHETTATMEELKHASAQIAENAGAVARVAEETLGAARAGRGAISEFIQAMQQIRSDGVAVADSIAKLSKRVERIGTVVEVIDEIADRSDLLALNAALEGSRAGEAGKGFSIVAAEMRRLAENVLDSTKEIKNLITEIRE
ncbi:MAG: methyl-accepting chemotaxis protein, partial [Myxococcaceae bacterium]